MKPYDPTIQIIETEEPIPCGFDAAVPTCIASPVPPVFPSPVLTIPVDETVVVPFPIDDSTPISSVGELPNTGGSADYEGAFLTLSLCAALIVMILFIALVVRPRVENGRS